MCNVEKVRQIISCVSNLPERDAEFYYSISVGHFDRYKYEVHLMMPTEQFRLVAEELGVEVKSRSFLDSDTWLYFVIDDVMYGTIKN